MLLKAQLDDYFLWKGVLVKVVYINEGKRSIGFEAVVSTVCPTCHQSIQYDIIEDSPLFQENAKPINTIK